MEVLINLIKRKANDIRHNLAYIYGNAHTETMAMCIESTYSLLNAIEDLIKELERREKMRVTELHELVEMNKTLEDKIYYFECRNEFENCPNKERYTTQEVLNILKEIKNHLPSDQT